ncbi:uncharacterized protein FOKN1_0216 [Thiohalobacter thiocyanaticus]|uniref:DUF58 domain-containing protein n=1 Tax=Thiohalobacter thiocyanaticus TaxID=585455 RepID=A0A1Z4VLY5_9GAMM|nr:DUF58 domain-containing protein [Thiohalobacter thiocyanaticus]BAZ92620.1 uncharacterized protein FOKN1_0216 [Thiohalobacter thiocyanaticus]
MPPTQRQSVLPTAERLLRRQPPVLAGSETLALDRRNIFILPTATGLGFVLLLLLLLLGAINYNNNLVFALTFLLAGVGVMAMLQTWRNLAGVRLELATAAPVQCGRPARFTLTARADGMRTGLALDSDGTAPVWFDIPAEAPARVHLDLPTRRRGWLRPGRIRLFTRYPLGLFHCWTHVSLSARTWVWPAPADTGGAPPQAGRRPSEDGTQGRGQDDFRGFRTYHPGDSLRLVDWKAYAREQGLQIKEFGGDRSVDYWLDFNALAEHDTEARLRRLVRWVLELDRDQQRYGLRLPGMEITLGRGPDQRERCLQALALFGVSD